MPTTALNQSARKKIVADTIATLRIEKLKPSDTLKAGLDSYVAGQKTTADLLNDIKSKYVSLRRG